LDLLLPPLLLRGSFSPRFVASSHPPPLQPDVIFFIPFFSFFSELKKGTLFFSLRPTTMRPPSLAFFLGRVFSPPPPLFPFRDEIPFLPPITARDPFHPLPLFYLKEIKRLAFLPLSVPQGQVPFPFFPFGSIGSCYLAPPFSQDQRSSFSLSRLFFFFLPFLRTELVPLIAPLFSRAKRNGQLPFPFFFSFFFAKRKKVFFFLFSFLK